MQTPVSSHPDVPVEPSPRWVRVVFAGQVIADSKRVVLMREKGHPPVYYFPRQDVRMDLLHPTEHRTHCPRKGEAHYWSVQVGDRRAENAVWSYPEPLERAPQLADYVAFDWDEMDAWFEEDEEVFVHARDPHTRVDALRSSRHVRVVLDDITIAETHRPVLLFETGLPTRYYIPKLDARQELLVPSSTRTRCPYKGEAQYYSVRSSGGLTEDIAWTYRTPAAAVETIRGMVCFFDEKVQAVFVDGVEQPRPTTL